MIPGLTAKLLVRLVEIGRNEAFEQLQEVFSDFPEIRSGQLMRQPFNEWHEVARRHSRDELVALIKVFTIAERTLPSFCGGSVSPVIPIYRCLLDTTGEDFTELRDWVVANTQNHFLPFGSSRYRPGSVSEYHRQVTEHEIRRRAHELADKEALAARRAARRKQFEELQLARTSRRQERSTLIESLQSLSVVQRLEHIISDVSHPVSFYPSDWALIDSASIRALSPELRFAAINRLEDRRKGVWRKLRQQLEQLT